MKRVCLLLALAVLLLCTPALADEAGVLTEAELNAWVNGLLSAAADAKPLNDPVGKDALKADGYAFLYDSATLYYDKPVLDAQSVLRAVSVTGAALEMPRNVRLGAPAQMLLTAYGWQNPTLAGDDAFAPLYVLNQLPLAAYWALAQRSGSDLQSVQCAVHARTGDDRYTDSGILYTVEDGEVAGIRVYGLNAFVTRAEVESNLTAVGGEPAAAARTAGVTLVSGAEPFGRSDLQFGRMDFLTLTETGAAVIFGTPSGEDWAKDDGGGWLHTVTYAGASLMFGTDADRLNGKLESLTVTADAFPGPRGIAVGMALQDALALFRCDGTGKTAGSAALLYGDGQTPPYATLETNGANTTLRYAATVADTDGEPVNASLYLTFSNALLTEIMVYTF